MKYKPKNPTKIDGRVVAEWNEESVLQMVSRFGHLRRAEIAASVWPSSSPESAKKMCSITVRRLLARRELEERPNALGGKSLVVALRGVRRLALSGHESADGRDLSSVDGPQFYHRALGTNYLIQKLREGAQVFGEYAILKQRAPATRAGLKERFNKFPDGLVLYPASSRGYNGPRFAADWIEVESNVKADADIANMMRIALRPGVWLDAAETTVIDRVVFLFDARQRHEAAFCSYLRREVMPVLSDYGDGVLHNIVFARAQIRTPLIWEGCTEVTAAEVLLRSTGESALLKQPKEDV
ncbi:hypothetical protein F6X40_17420 [Paraburkholderia sp. UCT31]|uniref:hypothetical protein n=1 Tax=Paraburkholderia sp. UCT31 TaxID=2615209 RepID=UPI0016566EE1|nr:hypothetical protein [Paraburkholderia sp. UCT31]MBC8738542.1 hypothetical protein [Paraburkholderia sp. UCT31]